MQFYSNPLELYTTDIAILLEKAEYFETIWVVEKTKEMKDSHSNLINIKVWAKELQNSNSERLIKNQQPFIFPSNFEPLEGHIIIISGLKIDSNIVSIERYVNISTPNSEPVIEPKGLYNSDTVNQLKSLYFDRIENFIPVIGMFYNVYSRLSTPVKYETQNKFFIVRVKWDFKSFICGLMSLLGFIVLFFFTSFYFSLITYMLCIICLASTFYFSSNRIFKVIENLIIQGEEEFEEYLTAREKFHRQDNKLADEANSISISHGTINSLIIRSAQAETFKVDTTEAQIMNAKKATFDNIKASSIDTDNLYSKIVKTEEARLGKIEASTIDTKTIESKKVNAEETNLGVIKATSVNTETIESKKVNAEEGNLGVIEASTINTETIESKRINAEEANLGEIEASTVSTETIDSKIVNAEEANLGEIEASTVNTETIESPKVNADETRLGKVEASTITSKIVTSGEAYIDTIETASDLYNEYLVKNQVLGITLNKIADYISSTKYPQKTIVKRYYKRFKKTQSFATLIGETIDLKSDKKHKQNVYNFNEVIKVLCKYLKEIKSENSFHDNLTEELLKEALKSQATDKYKAL